MPDQDKPLSLSQKLSLALYNMPIQGYSLFLHVAKLGNNKAAKWIHGRKGWRRQIAESSIANQRPVWIHAASLGEFEQARPLIAILRSSYPAIPILVTFFSPSGYEHVRHKGIADYLFYLPLDTASNARDFVQTVNPRFAIFVKYEFWYHYYRALATHNIPLFLISAIFRENQPFFRPYGRLFRDLLFMTTHIFTQDKNSIQLLAQIGYQRVTLAGDTRFDRVIEIADQRKQLPEIEQLLANRTTLVAGSTWPEDEEALAFYYEGKEQGVCMIIAPHEVDRGHIDQIVTRFGRKCVTYNTLLAYDQPPADVDVLIIDNIGMLASLYQYATIAYVGGGFSSGIHNVLEAAVYGVPVVFGPHYGKFQEAVDLIEEGGAFSVAHKRQCSSVIQELLTTDDKWQSASRAAYSYVHRNKGGTSIIFNHLQHRDIMDIS